MGNLGNFIVGNSVQLPPLGALLAIAEEVFEIDVFFR
jgi:hypothetical protein